jgi:hypothetical protein
MVLLVAGGTWYGYRMGKSKFGGGGSPKPTGDVVVHDPPIIVHGGSFHIATISATDPLKGTTVLNVPVDDVRPASSGGYYTQANPPAPAALVNFTASWAVQVCDDSACKHGVSICSNSKCDTSAALPPAGDEQITITSLDKSGTPDKLMRPGAPRQFQFEHRFNLNSNEGDVDAYHPRFLQFKQGKDANFTTYQCGVKIPTPPTKDWSSCWVELGQND